MLKMIKIGKNDIRISLGNEKPTENQSSKLFHKMKNFSLFL